MADEKNTHEMDVQLAQKRKALMNFRFGIAGSKSKNVKEARNLRKDIARILSKFNSKST